MEGKEIEKIKDLFLNFQERMSQLEIAVANLLSEGKRDIKQYLPTYCSTVDAFQILAIKNL